MEAYWNKKASNICIEKIIFGNHKKSKFVIQVKVLKISLKMLNSAVLNLRIVQIKQEDIKSKAKKSYVNLS
jgi:hypothetical protein